MNILLVDRSVPDYEVFIHSVNASTKAIPYSSMTTYEEIRAAIPGPVNQLGIVFIKGAMFLGQPFPEQYDFFQSLVTQFEIKHLDFLGCETLPEWNEFYARFTNVIIGASSNRTGNIQYGGDWTMESTMEDVEGIYFTKSIEYYKYLLDTDPWNTFFTKTTGELYGLGNNNNYNLGIATGGTYPVPTPIRINGSILMNVDKNLISSTREFTWIGIGDKLYCSGVRSGNYSGLNNSLFNYAQSTTFIEIPIHPTASGPITFVSTGDQVGAVVKGGKLYAQLGGTSFVPLFLPDGVTGTIKALRTPERMICVRIENTDPSGGSLYAIGTNTSVFGSSQVLPNFGATTLAPINYQGVPISGVTHYDSHISGSLCLRNGQMLYAGTTDTGRTVHFIPVPMPAGATGEIEYIEAGRQRIHVVIGGVLYGMGYNNWNQLGTGPTAVTTLSKIYLNGNTTPITGVTEIRTANAGTYITINNSLYGFGDNNSNQIGPNGTSATTLTFISANVVANGVANIQMSIGGSSTYNGRNYGPNGVTFHIVGELLSKIDYVQFGENRVLKTSMNLTATLATFAVPAGTGTVTPVVTDTDGSNYTLVAFHYSNPMTIQSLSSSIGNANQMIRIKGDLSAITSVKVGSATRSVTPLGNQEYSFVIPTKGAQSVVSIAALDQYGTESNSLSFTYATPEISSITNLSGQAITQATAGDKIKLLGTNFLTDIDVWFGTVQVLSTKIIRTTNSLMVTVPNVVGAVKIRCYDKSSNLAEYAPIFTCNVSTKQLATSTAVITYSTSIQGTLYYARTDKTIVRVIKNAQANEFQVVYTHDNDIYGLTNAPHPTSGNQTIYFGDRTTRKIYSLDTTAPSFPKVEFYSNVIMTPSAIKIWNGDMYVVCANMGASSPALIKISMSTGMVVWTRTYTGLESYQLRGLTFNLTDIYLSAVPFEGGIETNLTQGRVIKLDSTGTTQTIGFITGINNPIDLTFLAGYLVVDGNLEFFTPSGTPVSSFSTNAGTISVEGNNAYFTSNTGATSTLNQLTVEPYVNDTVLSIGSATPLSGPEGTLVFITGTLMSVSNIVKIEVNGTQLPLTEYWISSLLLTVRIPEGSGQATLRVTYGENLTKDFLFTYVNPDIVNVIPLYSQDVRRFHFTGNYLGNIVYVAFVDTQTTAVTVSNRKEVYNVTATSFDCAFDILPINSTRILLLDAYGNTTYEDSATFTLSSETCFLGGTPVLTDQGEISIDKIDPLIHTIGKKEIRAITKIRYNGDSLVLLEQHSLRHNYPKRDTVISRKHKIYYKGKMKTAESFVGHKGVQWVPYRGQFLYNVLLHTHEKMSLNGMICETLHPKNPIVKYFI